MNKDEENDIMSALKEQNRSLFAIGLLVVGIGGMCIGIVGPLILGMM